MRRSDLRRCVIEGVNLTWPFRWGKRFIDYARWEVRYLEALEVHPYRTKNISDADFFLIPISLGTLLTAGTANDVRQALDALFSQEIFEDRPSKNVLLTFIEPLFERAKVQTFRKYSGLSWADYDRMKDIILVKEKDTHLWHKVLSTQDARKGFWTTGSPEETESVMPMTKFCWSFSFAGAATDTASFDFSNSDDLSLSSFNNKPNYFFYHTTRAASLNNSTTFRHALVTSNVSRALSQPSSIGFDISKEEWLQLLKYSKFCLTIRGDNPNSRSLFRSISNGCIPLVVSDMLPAYAPIFRSLLRMEDYAILLKEEDFISDPIGTLNNVTSLSHVSIKKVLAGVKLVQRMILPDHPHSFFVPAFCLETMASMKQKYYLLN